MSASVRSQRVRFEPRAACSVGECVRRVVSETVSVVQGNELVTPRVHCSFLCSIELAYLGDTYYTPLPTASPPSHSFVGTVATPFNRAGGICVM